MKHIPNRVGCSLEVPSQAFTFPVLSRLCLAHAVRHASSWPGPALPDPRSCLVTRLDLGGALSASSFISAQRLILLQSSLGPWRQKRTRVTMVGQGRDRDPSMYNSTLDRDGGGYWKDFLALASRTAKTPCTETAWLPRTPRSRSRGMAAAAQLMIQAGKARFLAPCPAGVTSPPPPFLISGRPSLLSVPIRSPVSRDNPAPAETTRPLSPRGRSPVLLSTSSDLTTRIDAPHEHR